MYVRLKIDEGQLSFSISQPKSGEKRDETCGRKSEKTGDYERVWRTYDTMWTPLGE